MNQFRFFEWKVYKDSQDLFSKVLKIVKRLPPSYRFSIGDQLVRSALSIILNIAEGSGKHTNKELSRYIDIALGSSYESAACIDTLSNNDLLSSEERAGLLKQIEDICKQLGGFRKKLLK